MEDTLINKLFTNFLENRKLDIKSMSNEQVNEMLMIFCAGMASVLNLQFELENSSEVTNEQFSIFMNTLVEELNKIV